MSRTAIELKPGVTFCLRQFHGLIQELVQSAWARYIRRNNTELLGTTTDLMDFMFGSARGSLQVVAPVLREIQGDHCFYCGRTLGCEAGEAHVDHFIAWSRYPVDLGHNFVLADSRCNSAKAVSRYGSKSFRHRLRRLAAIHLRFQLPRGSPPDSPVRAIMCDKQG
jgi:5-methylcytosine-specific restriction endonuclease McrA